MNNAINRVLDRIDSLDRTLHQRFDDLEKRLTSCFTSIEHCTSPMDHSAPIINNTLDQSCIKFMEYSFKSIWILCGIFIICTLLPLSFY